MKEGRKRGRNGDTANAKKGKTVLGKEECTVREPLMRIVDENTQTGRCVR